VKPGVSGKLAFAASYRIDRHSIEDIVECCELEPRSATKIGNSSTRLGLHRRGPCARACLKPTHATVTVYVSRFWC
jgi:hypothetical protein